MSGHDDNWLHGERIRCPACGQELYRLDHSPFYDEAFLYCDRCPIHVEISYYDPVFREIVRALTASAKRITAIEARLSPCSCGGTFRHDAPRRCLACHAPVIVDDPSGIDLIFWSDFLLPNARDPTDQEADDEMQRHAPFTRTTDLWKDTPT